MQYNCFDRFPTAVGAFIPSHIGRKRLFFSYSGWQSSTTAYKARKKLCWRKNNMKIIYRKNKWILTLNNGHERRIDRSNWNDNWHRSFRNCFSFIFLFLLLKNSFNEMLLRKKFNWIAITCSLQCMNWRFSIISILHLISLINFQCMSLVKFRIFHSIMPINVVATSTKL